MTIDIKAPTFPESISEGTIARWLHPQGALVQRDQLLVEIETDKVVLEVVAPADGRLIAILVPEGETVLSEQKIGQFEEGIATAAERGEHSAAQGEGPSASPAARKLADESGIDMRAVPGSGRDGRITKDDIQRAVAASAATTTAAPPVTAAAPGAAIDVATGSELRVIPDERVERRVPMTRLRASIARRLVEAQQTAAMLTTFNEVDMTAVMALRSRHQDAFQKRHNGTRLGFMSFFVRASVEALKRFPAVNASIDGNDVVYHGYFDIGVAVSTDRGLVVPVIRDADALGLAQIEDQINDFGRRARDGKLAIEDMSGGTFTLSNGGIFGSLLSTPILNPPQTGILGMHKIQDRPVAIDGQVVIRPMMYLALSYDHRLIDGQEAVRFLVTIKDLLEDPARILLEL